MAKQDKYTAPRGTTTTSSIPQVNAPEEVYIPSADEQLDKAKEFYYSKKNIINYVLGGILALLLGYFAYNQFVKKPNEEEAANAIGRASTYMMMDSINLMLKGDANNMGVEKIADKYSGTKNGNIATYMAGIGNLKQGDFKKAIKYLENFKDPGTLLGTIAMGSLGDAYWENNQKDKATACYEKAGEDKDNFQYAPLYLQRAAIIYEQQGKTKEAITALKKIKEQFSNSSVARDVDKYLARLGETGE
jgi:predicted negative regulator of RcsB-dependent stress response